MVCGANNQIIVIIVNIIIVSILLIFLIRKYKGINTPIKVFLVMLISGGVSNLIDRIFRGHVVDYIDINDIFTYPVFNIADISVVIGAILLMGYIIINNKK